MEENVNKTHISILGMCVLRDILTLGKTNVEEKYVVDRFVQSISPITIIQLSIPFFDDKNIKKEIEDNRDKIFNDTSNFYKKMMLLDLNRGVLKYLGEIKSEYFLLDLGCLRYDIWWLLNEDKKYPVSINSLFEKYYKRMMDLNMFPKEYIKQDITSFEDATLYGYLDIFIEKIKELYDESRIILFEMQGMYEYLGKDGQLYLDKINESERFNQIISKGYNYVKNKLNGCHIVPFPKGILGDEMHIWGMCNFHYIKEYYQYAYEALEIITQKADNRVVEEVSLIYLKQRWEEKIYNKYYSIRLRYYKNSVETMKLNNRRIQYLDYFQKWIVENKSIQIKDIKTVAFYGLSQITKMMIPLFEEKGINIGYIVEDGLKSYNGYLVLSRNTKSFPKIDCMVIADLRIDVIKSKLSNRKIDFMITDIYELIGEEKFLDISKCY